MIEETTASVEETTDSVEVTTASVEEFEDIILEVHEEDVAYADGSTETIENSESEEYFDYAEIIEFLRNVDRDEESADTVDGFETDYVYSSRVLDAPRAVASDIRNLWKLEINGNQYDVLFPQSDDLVIQDGYLINTGGSNIVGVVVGSNGIDLSNYFTYTFTVLPLTGTNSQNTAYRYGAHSYLTQYSTNGTNNLVTTVSYIDAEVIKKPFGSSMNIGNLIIAGLLAVLIFVNLVGSIVRR